MSDARYYVAQAGKTSKGIRLIGIGNRTLEDARRERVRELKSNERPLAIYKITWGLVPEFIEGDQIVKGKS